MRPLAILLLAACSSSSSPPPKPVASLEAIERCPVGDNTSVEVYGFLVRELQEAGGDRKVTKQQLAYERELEKDPQNLKPQRAGIVEGETSHVLTTLCAGTPGCRAVALYDRGGFAHALSSHQGAIAPLGFADDARWTTLSTAPSGSTFELTADEQRASPRGVWVVFPVDGALAACIVDK